MVKKGTISWKFGVASCGHWVNSINDLILYCWNFDLSLPQVTTFYTYVASITQSSSTSFFLVQNQDTLLTWQMRVISIICIFLTVHTVFLLLYLGTLAACLGKSSSSCRRRSTSSQLTSPSPPTVGPSEPIMEGPPSDLKFWREKKHNPFYVKRPWITTCPTRFSDIPTALHRIRWWWEWRSDSNSSLAAGGRTAHSRPDPPKCKETSKLMWLSLIWFILVLCVC